MFGARGPSGFVLKTDIQLQMLGVRFDRRMADLEAVKKHKAPYVEDDGEIIEDSTFIRAHFEKKLGRDLDAGLDEAERGQAWALERLLEDRLNMIMIAERWLDDDNFFKGPAQFFARVPEAARPQVMDEVRAGIRTMMERHGLGRHSRGERLQLAGRDIEAVARMLGDKPFVFGAAPTAVDAIVYGEITACGTPFFDTPLVALVDRHANLRPYLERMDRMFFDDEQWRQAA
jgi:glutathione S-transferase